MEDMYNTNKKDGYVPANHFHSFGAIWLKFVTPL